MIGKAVKHYVPNVEGAWFWGCAFFMLAGDLFYNYVLSNQDDLHKQIILAELNTPVGSQLRELVTIYRSNEWMARIFLVLYDPLVILVARALGGKLVERKKPLLWICFGCSCLVKLGLSLYHM
jgi:hypothetical protein